jgi:hypothetical protein
LPRPSARSSRRPKVRRRRPRRAWPHINGRPSAVRPARFPTFIKFADLKAAGVAARRSSMLSGRGRFLGAGRGKQIESLLVHAAMMDRPIGLSNAGHRGRPLFQTKNMSTRSFPTCRSQVKHLIRPRHFDARVDKVCRELAHRVFFAVNKERTFCASLLLPSKRLRLVKFQRCGGRCPLPAARAHAGASKAGGTTWE